MGENDYLLQLLAAQRLREARTRAAACGPAARGDSAAAPYRLSAAGFWTLIGVPLAYARTWSKIVLNWCSSPSRST